ncbi:MAG TPA: hypothetical protein QGI62_08415 [Anaerolineales bacterium]|nr:hypothetical protein [Anaerolineales bacterium]
MTFFTYAACSRAAGLYLESGQYTELTARARLSIIWVHNGIWALAAGLAPVFRNAP